MTSMPATLSPQRKSEQGFTLVELAIVMIIIGLLIGGILKGQELITNARIASTISAIKNYDVAINTFKDKYDAVPGDMLNPGTRLANCTAANLCSIGGGNGNGRIDTNATGFAAAPGAEHQMAFVQMAAADVISGINPTNGAVWGGIYPSAQIGGGFHIAYVSALAAMPGATVAAANVKTGHYLALHNTPAGAVATTGIITPSQAFRIDNKMDDSNPSSGSVLNGGAATCINAGAYQESTDTTVCNMYIRVQQ